MAHRRAVKALVSFLPVLLLGPGCSQKSGPPNTAVTAATHTYFPITTGAHAVDCSVCHGSFSTFKQFTCTNCHGHDVQATTDLMHTTVANYTYSGSSCYQCHPTGARQAFDHAGITATTPGGCAQCHDIGATFAALPVSGFTHVSISSDCSSCHLSTSSWSTSAAPQFAADPSQDVTVTALLPRYTSTSMASVSSASETLVMPMNHAATAVNASAMGSCSNCHSGAVPYPGNFHSTLDNLGLAQPTSCIECHGAVTQAAAMTPAWQLVPTGLVGPLATSPARVPASGEMKHDAVGWANGAPTQTALVSLECGTCHASPNQKTQGWNVSLAGTTPAKYHPALTAAGKAQPGSCIDCHANSRPSGLLTPANATMNAGLQFDHAWAPTLDCASCHAPGTATQWTHWTGGRFHLASSTTPQTCLPCHANERPTSTAGWKSTTYTNSPFDYAGDATAQTTHGNGLDCVGCHNGPGTGAWGSTQNWVNGTFNHAASSADNTTCISCHVSQRPTVVINYTVGGSPATMDHSASGTGDCVGCHQATVTANRYVNWKNPSTGGWPGGDWQGGTQYPGAQLVGCGGCSTSQYVTVDEISLLRSGPNNLVTGTATASVTLYNEMLHTSTGIPAQLNPGPPGNPNLTTCWNCHTHDANNVVTSFLNGQFHPVLTSLGLPQPGPTFCMDCHTQMRPTGIVEHSASDLQPMDHNAAFTAGSAFASVTQMECGLCHTHPGNTWTDGAFHKNITGSTPADCTACHYPMEADAVAADVTSGILFAMRHASAQMTIQNCSICHATALGVAANTPIVATLWKTGGFHAHAPAQPARCNDCHAPVSEPAANKSTQGSNAYSLPMGQTATNGGQWMNHGSSFVAGQDCALCHLADAKTTGSAWSKSAQFHANVANPTTCSACHGTANGGGSVAGTNNNLPSGLTNSSTVTSAASDSATGVSTSTHDQINHADINVTSHDCNFCHTQVGPSTVAGIQGQEWAQAKFHVNFTTSSGLQMNGSTGRCSNCHMNVVPGPGITAQSHASFTNAAGTQDCSSCHSWPGAGGTAAPDWRGATNVPTYLNVGGFAVAQPPATSPTLQAGVANLPHPTVGTGTQCSSCHPGGVGGKNAIGYDHASTVANHNCNSCHEAPATPAAFTLVGTLWNGATAQSSGAGDTRPFTLTSITAFSGNDSCTPRNVTTHFYPVDCFECHKAPTGIATVTTGATYLTPTTGTGMWTFPHTRSNMSSSTCNLCHANGCGT